MDVDADRIHEADARFMQDMLAQQDEKEKTPEASGMSDGGEGGADYGDDQSPAAPAADVEM
eukprot:12402237-Karenia_brevis.AAC.1